MSSDNPDYWSKDVILRDGTKVQLRPEKKSDLSMLTSMLLTLSNDSKQYLTGEITMEEVEDWVTNLDYNIALPIVVLAENPPSQEKIIGAAVLSFNKTKAIKHRTTFDITIHDDYQNLGLGTILTQHMINVAHKMGLKKVCLKVHTDNERAIYVYKKCGFDIEGKLEMDYWNYITGEYGAQYQMALFL